MKTRFNCFAIAAVLCLTANSAWAANGTWNTTSGAWGTPGNWLGSVPGAAGDIANFDGPSGANRTITLDANRTVGVLNLGTAFGNYDLTTGTAGGQLTFNNSGTTAKLKFDGINARTISAPVVLNSSLDIESAIIDSALKEISGNITAGTSGTKVINFNAAAGGTGSVKISGIVSNGAGVVSIVQSATNGNMLLTGANTFTGGVELSAGVLRIGTSAQALGAGTLKLSGGNLEIVNYSSLNFGRNTEVTSDSNILIANGGTGGSRTWTLGTLQVGNKLTVHNTGGGLSLSSADTLIFGATTLTANTEFSVEKTGQTVPVLRLGALNGTSNLTKTGSGTIELLTAAGTYSGTTIHNAGTMIVGNNTALGIGKAVMSGTSVATLQFGTAIKIANDITYSNTNASSSIQRSRLAGAALDVGTSGTLKSTFAGGEDDTTAAIRAGTAGVGGTTLTMSFASNAIATPSNDGSRVSDVFNLSLTGSQTYVLQLSTGVSSSDPLYLGWLNGGSWVEATTGNTGSGGLAGQYASTWDAFLAANGGTFNAATMLGAYGYNAADSTAWAVLNHNSEYALVVPEPSTAILMGLGLGLTLFGFRTRIRRG